MSKHAQNQFINQIFQHFMGTSQKRLTRWYTSANPILLIIKIARNDSICKPHLPVALVSVAQASAIVSEATSRNVLPKLTLVVDNLCFIKLD